MEQWWSAPIREVVAGRRVIVAGAVAAGWVDHVDHLQGFGVDDILLFATEGRGVGPVPEVPTIALEPPDELSMMERIHYTTGVLAAPPTEVREALDGFDPDRSALVVGTFLNEAPELDGRPFLAWRRPEWVALEDKVVIDAFWDRAEVARQPSAVVALALAGAAAAELDQGAGTVWAADARDGFHGGGTGTFWVRDAASRDAALDSLAPRCDTVRVMPYVDGVACSIHGIVLPDGVVALRPVEMISLQHEDATLLYAGCATFWDPPEEVRASMREMVRRVGERLRAEVGFRGTFTIDGVVDAAGFWPTELNPRYGAGIMTIARASEGLPMLLLHDLVVAGYPIGRTASALESELVELADRHRGGGTWIPGATATVSVSGRDVSERDGEWSWADGTEAVAGTVVAGDHFVRCTYAPGSVPIGPSTAPRAASFWRFSDRELGTGIGPVRAG